jgi:hypothetical protein
MRYRDQDIEVYPLVFEGKVMFIAFAGVLHSDKYDTIEEAISDLILEKLTKKEDPSLSWEEAVEVMTAGRACVVLSDGKRTKGYFFIRFGVLYFKESFTIAHVEIQEEFIRTDLKDKRWERY